MKMKEDEYEKNRRFMESIITRQSANRRFGGALPSPARINRKYCGINCNSLKDSVIIKIKKPNEKETFLPY
jgi:hypothetical protein